jgi:hypothetical protein
MTLLRPDHTFDRSAIMVEAIRLARRETAGYARTFKGEHLSWSKAMSYGLRKAWEAAKQARSYQVWLAEHQAERARVATLTAHEQEIARLQNELVGADFIDSTAAMMATKFALVARLAQMGA